MNVQLELSIYNKSNFQFDIDKCDKTIYCRELIENTVKMSLIRPQHSHSTGF